MKVIDVINSDNPTISMEVFPPKQKDKYESIEKATEEIALYKPGFMSVTYGAGGGTSEFTVSIASNLEKKYDIPILAHLTCISSTKEGVRKQLELMKEKGITNVLALRGDIPEDTPRDTKWEYSYATELIREIKEFDSDMCIGGACYPEVHPDSENQIEDIKHLKEKVDAGCEFLTTQMFFDNSIFYNFLYKVREAGIYVPIVPGIMPLTNINQLKRTLKLSGTVLPQRFRFLLDKFGSDEKAMKQAGLIYASEQIIDLYANGIKNVHVYSMNKPEVAKTLMTNFSEIIKWQQP
ncbi:MAG: methylenetetrahydrofolate reductase [NAD(P)H] [Lachnospiraceae bacterium]|nr:methylenetetrahydrofolate reductase [NAD(P)H] [Lachnospiraceae bacterium]